MRTSRTFRGATALAALAVVATAPAVAEEILAVTADNTLITFDSARPENVTSYRTIRSVDGPVVAIDVRPRDGVLYALTDSGRLFRIDRKTGDATAVGGGVVSRTIDGRAGMSFDPATDRIRVVTVARENLRVDPDDGAVVDTDETKPGTQTDSRLAYAVDDPGEPTGPFVVAAAHTDRIPVARTTCFVIDSNLDVLARLGDADGDEASRNSGELHTVGLLGVDATEVVGFDISLDTGRAYAALTTPGDPVSKLYAVSLFSGAATVIGAVGDARTISAITVAPLTSAEEQPVPVEPVPMIGLTTNGELVSFSSDAPSTITDRKPPVGLDSRLLAIALRTSNRKLYGISNTKLYVLDSKSGTWHAAGAPFAVPLQGTQFGFDFNPETDVARIVSNTGQNRRVNPDTGEVVDDTPLTLAGGGTGIGPVVVAGAYDRKPTPYNGFPAPPTFYGIDSNLDALVRLNSPGGAPSGNGGAVRTVGALGLDVTNVAGIEIVGNSTAFAALSTTVGGSRLYSIDLATGATALVGSIGISESIQSLAASPSTPADVLLVAKMAVRMDSVTMSGSLPFPDAGLDGRRVAIDLDGFTKEFVLDHRGVARDDAGTRRTSDDDRLQFVGKPANGRIRFVLALRRESLPGDLVGGGARETRTVRVTLTVDGVAYPTDVTLRYSGRSGRSGIARTQ